MIRYADEDKEKLYRTATTKVQDGGDQIYVFPPKDEDPSPMYQGLRTNLPHVSLISDVE